MRDPTRCSNGLRFYLSLLMVLLYSSDLEDKELYLRIPNRDFGNPFSVSYFGTQIDMDYFQSVQEYKAISKYLDLNDSTILEIGGGYGRLAHTVLSLADGVKEFILVDIPTTLRIAQGYLSAVLPDALFRKLTFVDALKDFPTFERGVDLVINVDSMNEMDADVVKAYLAWINENASYFYVNNPVGKYLFPPDLDPDEEAVRAALSVGPITDIFDLWDTDAINARLPLFQRTYAPGGAWGTLYIGRALPWTYYAVAIYEKKV